MNIVKPILPAGWSFAFSYDEDLGESYIECSGPGYNWSSPVTKSDDPITVQNNVNSILAAFAERAAAAEKFRAEYPTRQQAEEQAKATARSMANEIAKAIPVVPLKNAVRLDKGR
jgi:hypothetical protein